MSVSSISIQKLCAKLFDSVNQFDDCPIDCKYMICFTDKHPYGETTAPETTCECNCDFSDNCPAVLAIRIGDIPREILDELKKE